jgi:sterol carrier protein 2
MCGNRQVKNVQAALQHNIGLGGAAVVALYRLGFPNQFVAFPSNKLNPAQNAYSFEELSSGQQQQPPKSKL